MSASSLGVRSVSKLVGQLAAAAMAITAPVALEPVLAQAAPLVQPSQGDPQAGPTDQPTAPSSTQDAPVTEAAPSTAQTTSAPQDPTSTAPSDGTPVVETEFNVQAPAHQLIGAPLPITYDNASPGTEVSIDGVKVGTLTDTTGRLEVPTDSLSIGTHTITVGTFESTFEAVGYELLITPSRQVWVAGHPTTITVHTASGHDATAQLAGVDAGAGEVTSGSSFTPSADQVGDWSMVVTGLPEQLTDNVQHAFAIVDPTLQVNEDSTIVGDGFLPSTSAIRATTVLSIAGRAFTAVPDEAGHFELVTGLPKGTWEVAAYGAVLGSIDLPDPPVVPEPETPEDPDNSTKPGAGDDSASPSSPSAPSEQPNPEVTGKPIPQPGPGTGGNDPVAPADPGGNAPRPGGGLNPDDLPGGVAPGVDNPNPQGGSGSDIAPIIAKPVPNPADAVGEAAPNLAQSQQSIPAAPLPGGSGGVIPGLTPEVAGPLIVDRGGSVSAERDIANSLDHTLGGDVDWATTDGATPTGDATSQGATGTAQPQGTPSQQTSTASEQATDQEQAEHRSNAWWWVVPAGIITGIGAGGGAVLYLLGKRRKSEGDTDTGEPQEDHA